MSFVLQAVSGSFKRSSVCITCTRSFAAPAKGKAAGGAKKAKKKDAKPTGPYIGPEHDKCTGANFYTTGEDPKLKPDDQYPKWLWTLLDPRPSLEEMDPSEKRYWSVLRREKMKQNNYSRSKKSD
eukprot:Colp12_sorted_trinity150504_noHs@10152